MQCSRARAQEREDVEDRRPAADGQLLSMGDSLRRRCGRKGRFAAAFEANARGATEDVIEGDQAAFEFRCS